MNMYDVYCMLQMNVMRAALHIVHTACSVDVSNAACAILLHRVLHAPCDYIAVRALIAADDSRMARIHIACMHHLA
jgi:hypothetical protein